ncbi:hypothetical protein DdX_08008 [Ditylenchus destructor]|uniref:Uncharacterized protein n=1 Tax=Ditylenchus destructor TaxID=166010 RepID=A0AAD4N5M3_9BILA|nr:hypothetical protein DdX_08008 [Ditylenchus destructor]
MGKPKERLSSRKPTNVPDDKACFTVSQYLGYMPKRQEIQLESQRDWCKAISQIPTLYPSEAYYESPQQRFQYSAVLIKLQNLFRQSAMHKRTSDTLVAHRLVEEFEKAYAERCNDPPLKSYFYNDAHKENYDDIFRRLSPYTDHMALHSLARHIERMEELISEIDSMQKCDENSEVNS